MPQPASAASAAAANTASAAPRYVSIAAYARMRGASWSTVKHHCKPGGLIKLTPDGLVDTQQADASWGRTRRAPYLSPKPGTATSAAARSAAAKIRRLKARLELARHRFDVRQDGYAERSEAVRIGILEAEHLVAGLAVMPANKAEGLATRLSIDAGPARDLLERFVASCLAGIGDLRSQAIRAVEQA
jgi:hypothetical protein